MNQGRGLLTRPQLFFLSLGILAIGLVWNVYESARKASLGEGSVPTTGSVVSVMNDSQGCESKWPFARHDCRFVVKIRHRPEGSPLDETYLHVDRYYFEAPPGLQKGDPVKGSCQTVVGLRGRCQFEELVDPAPLPRVLAVMGFLFCGVFGLVYLRRR